MLTDSEKCGKLKANQRKGVIDLVTIEKLTLRQARQLAGKTQKETAQRFGVTTRTIHRWESGKGFPTIDVFSELCKFYGVGMDDIDLLRPKSSL